MIRTCTRTIQLHVDKQPAANDMLPGVALWERRCNMPHNHIIIRRLAWSLPVDEIQRNCFQLSWLASTRNLDGQRLVGIWLG